MAGGAWRVAEKDKRETVACEAATRGKDTMKLRGRVHNGFVVLEGGATLPEGTRVTVACDTAPVSQPRRRRKPVQFPLIRSKHPGTLHLTNERIAEILDEEDAAPRR